LTKVGFPQECPMKLYGDNKAAIHIAKNDVFHERTKHIEINCLIVRKKLKANIIVAKYVASGHQLVDFLLNHLLEQE